MTKRWRIFGSIVFAAIITFVGAEAFLLGVHDSSLWLKMVLTACVPIAVLASKADFFDSNLVYWGSIAAGFILWGCLGYIISSHFRQS